MADQIQISGTRDDVSARLDRVDWASFVVTALVTLSGYWLTLAPEITLEYPAVTSVSAMYGGVGPPPGYPVWTLYSGLFVKLIPCSNPARRVAFGSAVAGAVACALIALMVSSGARMLYDGVPAFERFTSRERNFIRIVCGCVAGLALGFSNGFWFKAVMPEFWTFNALLFATVIYLLTRWMATARKCFCWLAFLVYGLLLTSDEELIIGLPGLVCAVMVVDPKLGRDAALSVLPLGAAVGWLTSWPVMESGRLDLPMLAAFGTVCVLTVVMVMITLRLGSEWKFALACAFFLLLGLSVYLYVPIASMTNPPVNWGYARTVEGFYHVVSRGQYERANPTADFTRFAAQLWALLKQTGHEFGWIYLAFAALPFCFLWRMTTAGWKWTLSSLLILICIGPLLSAALNLSIDRQSQEIAEPYFFPLRVIVAVCTGIGLVLFAIVAAAPGRGKQLAPA